MKKSIVDEIILKLNMTYRYFTAKVYFKNLNAVINQEIKNIKLKGKAFCKKEI